MFMSKLCISEGTKNFLLFNEYKTKMSQLLQSTPEVSLYKDKEIPPHLREVAILTGYRSPTSTVKECALSVFVASNETLNFWTHFIPPFYFFYQLVNLWDALKVINDSYYWPFVVYMITICIYPLTSALAHTFCTISEMARHIWFFLDYGGLSLYSFGAGLFIRAYAFPEELLPTVLGIYFIEILTFLSTTCAILACYSRFVENTFLVKLFRLGAFALPWIWDNIPVVYRLSNSVDVEPLAAEHYYLQFFFSFCISFFYASHLPERLAPGKFDFCGNSHQLLHICAIMATHYQMSAVIIDMHGRREMMQLKYPFPEHFSTFVSPLLLFNICATIVVFTICAKQYEDNRKDLKRAN